MAPTFFPIAVWGSYAHEVSNVAEDKAVGINTYVWVADPTRLVHAEYPERRPAGDPGYELPSNLHRSETAGWLLETRSICSRCPEPARAPTTVEGVEANPDGRFYYTNYGKGVIFWQNRHQAACWVNYDDVNSADIYWFTDGNVCRLARKARASTG